MAVMRNVLWSFIITLAIWDFAFAISAMSCEVIGFLEKPAIVELMCGDLKITSNDRHLWQELRDKGLSEAVCEQRRVFPYDFICMPPGTALFWE